MNIKVFCAWLTRNNYPFKMVNYGENSYFYNAPGYIYQAINIFVSGANIADIKKQLKPVEAYCKKYNLDIFSRSSYLYNYITGAYDFEMVIRTPENAAEAANYYQYRDASLHECENLIHKYHVDGIYKTHGAQLNNELKKIMDYYGALYNRSLIKAVNL